MFIMGVHWLSGRVLDSRQRGCGFKPHRLHCIVVMSKNINPSLVLVQPRKTRPFIIERLLMGHKESDQTKQNMDIIYYRVVTEVGRAYSDGHGPVVVLQITTV